MLYPEEDDINADNDHGGHFKPIGKISRDEVQGKFLH